MTTHAAKRSPTAYIKAKTFLAAGTESSLSLKLITETVLAAVSYEVLTVALFVEL
jgi:hypothetical protein